MISEGRPSQFTTRGFVRKKSQAGPRARFFAGPRWHCLLTAARVFCRADECCPEGPRLLRPKGADLPTRSRTRARRHKNFGPRGRPGETRGCGCRRTRARGQEAAAVALRRASPPAAKPRVRRPSPTPPGKRDRHGRIPAGNQTASAPGPGRKHPQELAEGPRGSLGPAHLGQSGDTHRPASIDRSATTGKTKTKTKPTAAMCDENRQPSFSALTSRLIPPWPRLLAHQQSPPFWGGTENRIPPP